MNKKLNENQNKDFFIYQNTPKKKEKKKKRKGIHFDTQKSIF